MQIPIENHFPMDYDGALKIMKKIYIKPEVVIEFFESDSLLAASPTVTVNIGEDVEEASADTKEHSENWSTWDE